MSSVLWDALSVNAGVYEDALADLSSWASGSAEPAGVRAAALLDAKPLADTEHRRALIRTQHTL